MSDGVIDGPTEAAFLTVPTPRAAGDGVREAVPAVRDRAAVVAVLVDGSGLLDARLVRDLLQAAGLDVVVAGERSGALDDELTATHDWSTLPADSVAALVVVPPAGTERDARLLRLLGDVRAAGGAIGAWGAARELLAAAGTPTGARVVTGEEPEVVTAGLLRLVSGSEPARGPSTNRH